MVILGIRLFFSLNLLLYIKQIEEVSKFIGVLPIVTPEVNSLFSAKVNFCIGAIFLLNFFNYSLV